MRGLILFGFILNYAVLSGKCLVPIFTGTTYREPRKIFVQTTTEKPPEQYVPNDKDHFQPKPEMSKPPNCPLMPFFIGFDGNSIQTNKQIHVIDSIVDISKQIAGSILDPNAITGTKTLSKFTTMTGLIRTMSFDQIKQTSAKIYMKFPEIEIYKNKTEYIAWSAFRDGVSQAGTGPAFLMMKEWIMNGQVKGEEAAELLSVLPNTARHPTTDYMNNFFDLVTNEKVTSQNYLNVSSILSFTNLVRKALVNNETAHNRFPVHAFGSFAPKDGKDNIQKYMLYLSNKLNEAVTQGNGIKIQVYIRALGNTAHKEILNVFEPYLEGQRPISDFQRLTIIASLDKITKTNPQVTRAVLYNMYQNTGEAQEIRVAAVVQLMKTNPPAPILQRMAQFTNQDHNNQVISVVKSAIEEASRLNTIQTRKLAMNARSAVNLLTTKELGVQYSKSFIRSYIFENDFLGYNSDFSYIQGRDGVIPSSIFYNHMRNMGGLKRQNFQMALMSSSSDDLLNFVFDHLAEYPQKMNQSKNNSESKWSWENMDNMFKFDMDYAKHVEGNFMFTTLGGRRFFPFDNKTIESIQDDLKKFSYDFKIGKIFNFTKLYDQHEIKLAFPTATGLPFMFSLNAPTLVHIDGEFVGKAHPDFSLGEQNKIFVPRSANASLDINYTYSSKLQGKMGFTAPFNHKVYTTSLDKNMHLHVPLHIDIDLDRQNQIIRTKIHPLRPKTDYKLFECSSQAYTTSKNISDLNPWNEKKTNTIHIMKEHNFETTFGQNNGFAFDLKMQGEHKSFDTAKMFLMAKQHNWQSALLYPSYEDSISNHNLTLTFNSEISTAKFAKIHLSYRNIYHSSEINSKYGQKNKQFSLHHERKQRFQDMINRAAGGIRNNQVRILDAELSFDDSLKYVATATQSSGSEKTRFMFGINKFSPKSDSEKAYQISFQIDAKMPKVALENYKKALESDPTSYLQAWLNYGKDEKSGASISLDGILKRTEDRLDFLKNHQVSKDCLKQMKNGNYIQPACRNVTANANFLDNYKLTIEYKNVPDCCKNMTYKAYGMARQAFYPWVSDRMTKNEKDKIDLEVQFSTNLKYVNVSIDAPVLSSRMENINVDQMVIPWVVTHPEYNAWERFSQKIFSKQQFPVCAIDSNMITTFDDKQYPFKIGNCWRLIAHTAPKPRYKLKGISKRYVHPENEQMSLIAREVGSSTREFVLMLGKNVVYVQPTKSKDLNVQINGKNTTILNSKIFKDNMDNVYLKINILPTGSMMLEAPQTGMQVIFDGYRIKTQVSNSLRNQMRGICGNFDGEEANEFISPKNCIMKNPLHFVTSYTLSKGCNEDLKDIYKQIEKMPCTKEIIQFSDAVNNVHCEEPESVNAVAPKRTKDSSCIDRKVKTIEKSENICFSSKAEISCSSECVPDGEIEKYVKFYCVPNNHQAKRWVEMVKKGGIPDLSQKGSSIKEMIKLPKSCKRAISCRI